MIARAAAMTLLRSGSASDPNRLRIFSFGKVNIFQRITHGRDNPALAKSSIVMSCAHCERAAVVIIAQTECRVLSLKVLFERTTEGRRFNTAMSTNGNGTVTTSPRSQITERLFVLWRIPFVREQVAHGG